MVLLFDHSTLADHCVIIEFWRFSFRKQERIGSGAFVEARQTVILMGLRSQELGEDREDTFALNSLNLILTR